MLEGKNIYKNINGLEVLKDVNIQIKPSKITCLIGPSGSGKSTTLSCLSLLTSPSSGNVIVDGENFAFLNENTTYRNFPYPTVSVVFQGLFLWPHLSNLDNILLPLKKLHRTLDEIENLISRFKIKDIIHKFPNQCSGGEKQRVALTRQILLQPKYLLLDEVTSALDLETVKIVGEILTELKEKGMGILLVTHLINFAKMISDDFYFMDNGGVIENGIIENLKNPNSSRLQKFLQIYN